MIEIKKLNKYFSKGGSNEVHALRDINLTVSRGDFIVLLGANGSGKSTLLNAIAGSIRCDSGEIYISNTNVTEMPEHIRSKFVSRVFQDPLAGTASGLTIVENFRLASLRTAAKKLIIGTGPRFRGLVSSRIRELMPGLERKVNQPMSKLSGGQRQAMTLLMAVMDDSKVLLMDEPASALDPKTAEKVMHLADDIVKQHNLTTLLVTHNIRDAVKFGNRLILMDAGQVIKDIKHEQKRELTLDEIYKWF